LAADQSSSSPSGMQRLCDARRPAAHRRETRGGRNRFRQAPNRTVPATSVGFPEFPRNRFMIGRGTANSDATPMSIAYLPTG
jgi:hypothetical protein